MKGEKDEYSVSVIIAVKINLVNGVKISSDKVYE